MKPTEYVLLIHGFYGGIYEVQKGVPSLQREGFQTKMLKIAGHGNSKEEMKKSDRFQWYNSIKRQALQYGKFPVHLLGFSMGGLLAARYAAEYQYKLPLKSLILVGTPIHLFSFRNSFDQIWNRSVQMKNWDEGLQLLSNSVKEMQNSIPPVESLIDFSMLLQKYKTYFSHIHIPTCVIQGRKDAVVHPSSAKWIYRHLPLKKEKKELHFVQNGRHQLFLNQSLLETNLICKQFLTKHRF